MFHKKKWVYLASSLKVTLGNIRGLYIGGVLILPAIDPTCITRPYPRCIGYNSLSTKQL